MACVDKLVNTDMGWKLMLVASDELSRKLWMVPMQTKRAHDAAEISEKMTEHSGLPKIWFEEKTRYNSVSKLLYGEQFVSKHNAARDIKSGGLPSPFFSKQLSPNKNSRTKTEQSLVNSSSSTVNRNTHQTSLRRSRYHTYFLLTQNSQVRLSANKIFQLVTELSSQRSFTTE